MIIDHRSRVDPEHIDEIVAEGRSSLSANNIPYHVPVGDQERVQAPEDLLDRSRLALLLSAGNKHLSISTIKARVLVIMFRVDIVPLTLVPSQGPLCQRQRPI